MRARKSCYTCKHYKHGLCSEYNTLICIDDMSCWELSDDAKVDVLHDAVNSPAHYTSGGIECIDCIKAALGENFIGFLIGNVIKYTYRYKNKNGLEDLKKRHGILTALSRSSAMKTSELLSPCKDCPDRHRACHDSCERYKHYKQCREELKRYTREMNAIEGIEIARVERIKRNARRKFGGENQ